MIIFRRARGTVGRSLGAVTQVLDCLGAEGKEGHGMPAHGEQHVSRGRAAQYPSPHQHTSVPLRMAVGKATDSTAENSESLNEKVSEMGGRATGTTAGSESSESHSKDGSDTEMGENQFQSVLLAAAMKHVVRGNADVQQHILRVSSVLARCM